MNLSAKKMSDEDIPFICRVLEQNKAILYCGDQSLKAWYDYFSSEDKDPHESHHIIMADADPAAWLKIHSWNKPEICISMLVVDDLFKHKGVGRFAIQFAENMARYWAKSAVRVQTTRDNIIATECYLKCGYEIVREMIYKVGDGVDREGYEFIKSILPEALTEENLREVLTKMFGTKIVRADFKSKQLHGGTVGDVRLVTGNAETADGRKLPYKLVLKAQKKWERCGDPCSWRREYDLYKSDFGALFSDSFRWPECYRAEMNEEENETRLWMEYVDGVSGLDLTGEMCERAAEELGRFQGRLYAEQPAILKSLTNLSNVDFIKNFYLRYRSSSEVYDYIRSDSCEIPKRLCNMLISIDENEDEIWSRIGKLPIVLCHRDFWVTNIIRATEKTALIDWDTAGWGHFGEDIASLIADEADADHMIEYYQKCVPAYYKGFSEYTDISYITDHCVRELILVMFGYRLVERYKFAKTPDEKTLCLNMLEKIYEMERISYYF